MLIEDIAALPSGDNSGEAKYIVLWSGPEDPDEKRWVITDADEETLRTTEASIGEGKSARTVTVRTDASGNRYYCAIWSSIGSESEMCLREEGYDLPYKPQFEVAWAPPGALLNPLEVSRATPPQLFTAIRKADVTVESKLIQSEAPLDPAQLRDYWEQGYRPIVIANSTMQASTTSDSRLNKATCLASPAVSLLLQRPIIPDFLKETLSLNQARAAVALLQMNASQRVWPLLHHQPDPRTRSYFLHFLTAYKFAPQSILEKLEFESEVSSRRILILALGDYAAAGLLSDGERGTLRSNLLAYFSEDKDPGVHAACEWALRQLGATEEIQKLTAQFSNETDLGTREWYVTKQGQHTMVILHPAEPFAMGSPVTEAERYGGPKIDDEALHYQYIGRDFAIASHEVTVEQYQAFRKSHPINRVYSEDQEAPANSISWFDAVAYCNWLSEREGIPRDEWCYNPDQPFDQSMELDQTMLQKKGYRLPTEAEWEYACRAGAVTARHFGETERLLTRYAWFAVNSETKKLLPVGLMECDFFGCLGKYSFGIYVLNKPILAGISSILTMYGCKLSGLELLPVLIASCAMCFAAACFSWRLIERPALSLKRFFPTDACSKPNTDPVKLDPALPGSGIAARA